MKVTAEMLEKMGVAQIGARNRVLEIFAEMESRIAELEEALTGKDGELAESRKLAAMEKAILEAGGRNVRAILALIDGEKVTFDGKELKGLDLNAVKAEAPYLFYEKEEKRTGTGMRRGQTAKENEISAAFKKGLRR